MTRFEWKRLIWFRPGSIEIFDRVPLKCWVGWFWSDSKGQSPSSLQFWEIALQTSIFSCQHNHERGLVISVSGISFCSYLIIVWLLRIRHLLNPQFSMWYLVFLGILVALSVYQYRSVLVLHAVALPSFCVLWLRALCLTRLFCVFRKGDIESWSFLRSRCKSYPALRFSVSGPCLRWKYVSLAARSSWWMAGFCDRYHSPSFWIDVSNRPDNMVIYEADLLFSLDQRGI